MGLVLGESPFGVIATEPIRYKTSPRGHLEKLAENSEMLLLYN